MPDRRTVVRALGVAAAGTAGALAGCSGLSDPLGPPPSPPAYADWLHRPDVATYVDAVDPGSSQRFTVAYVRPARILDGTDELLSAAGDRWTDDTIVRTRLDRRHRGLVDPGEVDHWVAMAGRGQAVDGSAVVGVRGAMGGTFDGAAVASRLEGSSHRLEDAGTHGGFDRRRWRDRNLAVAIGDDRVLLAEADPQDPSALSRPIEDVLASVIDVVAGRRSPAHEADDDLRSLVGHLGDGLAVRGSLPPGREFADLDGLVGWGASSVAVEDLRQRWVGVFREAVPIEALERRLRAGYFVELDDLQRHGRTAVATGTVDLPVWLA